MKIVLERTKAIVTVGAILVALVPASQVIADIVPGAARPARLVALALGLLAAAVLLAELFRIQFETIRARPRWRSDLLYQALRRAKPDAEIWLATTSFHDWMVLFPELEALFMERGKRFKLFVMLIDPETPQIQHRFKFRSEGPVQIAAQVVDQMKHLEGLRDRVNARWLVDYSGAKLHLELRFYDGFLFGPYYQVGEEVLFVGMNLAHQSGAVGPMIEVRGPESSPWLVLRAHLETLWAHARVYL